MTGRRLLGRVVASVASVALAAVASACAYANGYDPSRYAATPAPAADPEVEPLPRSPKRQMRDPRGRPERLDAGTGARDL